jgi:hypothetical protein
LRISLPWYVFMAYLLDVQCVQTGWRTELPPAW